MKKRIAALLLAVSAFAASFAARADLIWYEPWNYSDGNLPLVATNGLGQTNLWYRQSGTGNDLFVHNKRLEVAATGGNPVSRQDDCRRPLYSPTGTSYTNSVQVLYASFTVICTNLMNGAGTYFATYYSTANGYFGRIQALTNGTSLPNTWRLGVSGNASSTATGVLPVDLATNVPYQVVVELDPVTLQAASLWVNPINSGDPAAISSDSLGKALTSPVDSFAFRQASSWGNGFMIITNLALATTFDEAATNVWATNAIAPVIVEQPVGVTNFVNVPVTLSAIANGQGLANLTYQWLKNGQPFSNPNGNTNVLSFPSPQITDSGTYALVVTTPYGLSVTSSPANVSISAQPVPPKITSGPNSQSVYVGQNVTFSVEVTSPGNLTYQWMSNNVPIPGANDSSYTLTDVQTNFAANYTVGVTNDVVVNGVVSSNAVLTVLTPPVVNIGYLRTLVDPSTYAPTNVPPTLPYTITAVVTTFTNLTSGNTSSYYLEDGTGGINIFATFGSDFRPAQGDIVTFTGVLSSYTSGLELYADTNDLAYTSYEIVGHTNTLPAPVVIPFTATNNLDNVNYHLAGELVTLQNVYFGTNADTEISTNANQTITVTNAQGQSFNLTFFDLDLDTAGQTLPAFAYSVTGILYGGNPNFSVGVTRFADIVTNAPVLPIALNAQASGTNIVLNWSDPSFSLQSSTNAAGPYSTISGATSPYTNSSGTGNMFFRLIH